MFRALLTGLGLAAMVGCTNLNEARTNFQSNDYTHTTAELEENYRNQPSKLLQEKLNIALEQQQEWKNKSKGSCGNYKTTIARTEQAIAIYNVLFERPETLSEVQNHNNQLYLDAYLMCKAEKGDVIKLGNTPYLFTGLEEDEQYDSFKNGTWHQLTARLELQNGKEVNKPLIRNDWCGPYLAECQFK